MRDKVPVYTNTDVDVAAPQEYRDYTPENSFTVTGHLAWVFGAGGPEIKPRVLSSLVFATVDAALEAMRVKYGRVFKDVSRPEFGVWGAVVPRPPRNEAQEQALDDLVRLTEEYGGYPELREATRKAVAS